MTELSPLRTGRITGSRVGAILGLKKDKKPADVMRELVRDYFGDPPEFLGNEMTEYGKAMEEPARAEYERLTGDLVLDAQEFVIHPEYDFLGYSPDGRIGADGLYEGKAPSQWAKWQWIADKPDFYAQVQLGMACMGLAWCHFFRWVAGGPNIPEMVPFDPEWLPANLPALQAFHDDYQRIITNPDLAAPYRADLVALMDDPEMLMVELELAQILEKEDALAERKAALREQLTEYASAGDAKTVRGRFLQVTKVANRGSVKYKDAVAALAPGADLTPYTEPARDSFRISRIKESE